MLYQKLTNKLEVSGGILIVFVQLRDNGQWFAPDQVKAFPAYAYKYFQEADTNGEKGYFESAKLRETLPGALLYVKIPCLFNRKTKMLERVEDIEQKQIEM